MTCLCVLNKKNNEAMAMKQVWRREKEQKLKLQCFHRCTLSFALYLNTYVNGKPQQIDAACNAFKVFLAEESALAEPPTTSPVATKPSMTAQIKRWIGFCSSLPLAANVSTTNEPESNYIILNVKRKKV